MLYMNCLFCVENRFSINKRLDLPGEESIIWEDEQVYVAPDLFPICVGHMLISSKLHYNSFANAPTITICSVKRAIEFLKTNIFKEYPITIFEHGAVVKHSAGASIDHAHSHIVPISFDLQVEIENSSIIMSNAEPCILEDLYKLGIQNQPYIFCQGINRPPVIFRVNELPSQFLRRLIANKLGCEYNWKKSIGSLSFKERFVETRSRYGGINEKTI